MAVIFMRSGYQTQFGFGNKQTDGALDIFIITGGQCQPALVALIRGYVLR